MRRSCVYIGHSKFDDVERPIGGQYKGKRNHEQKRKERKFADVAYKLASQFGDIEGPISERRPRAKMMTGQLFKCYTTRVQFSYVDFAT